MKLGMAPNQACLLLGSNIDPEQNLPRAIQLLHQHVEVTDISRVWETPAVGSGGANFLNAAVLVRTQLEPETLKNHVCRVIEARLGRVRTTDKYAPRTIDIDLIAWECNVTDPGLWQFAHAAVPVSEILPCDVLSDQGETLGEAAARLSQSTSMQIRAELDGDAG